MSTPAETVLDVSNLRVGFRTESGLLQAVDDAAHDARRAAAGTRGRSRSTRRS